jgi:hypothetical protein
MGPLGFVSDLILPATPWPWGRLILWYKWVPGISPAGKGHGCLGLTSPPSCADSLEILGASTCWNPRGYYKDSYTFCIYAGRFIMFCMNTNIYNQKPKGPTLMELFTATGELKKKIFFGQLEMFDVCSRGDTAHIDTIFKFLPHTSQHGCNDILHCCVDPCLKAFLL